MMLSIWMPWLFRMVNSIWSSIQRFRCFSCAVPTPYSAADSHMDHWFGSPMTLRRFCYVCCFCWFGLKKKSCIKSLNNALEKLEVYHFLLYLKKQSPWPVCHEHRSLHRPQSNWLLRFFHVDESRYGLKSHNSNVNFRTFLGFFPLSE